MPSTIFHRLFSKCAASITTSMFACLSNHIVDCVKCLVIHTTNVCTHRVKPGHKKAIDEIEIATRCAAAINQAESMTQHHDFHGADEAYGEAIRIAIQRSPTLLPPNATLIAHPLTVSNVQRQLWSLKHDWSRARKLSSDWLR